MEYTIVFKMTCFDVVLKLRKLQSFEKNLITYAFLEQPKKRLTIDVPSQVLLSTVLLLEPDILGVFCQCPCRYPARMYVLNKNPQLASVKYFG